MKKFFTFAACALMASAAWAGVITLDLSKPINPSSLEYNENGIWTQCYNDQDYTWLKFGDKNGTFMLSHLIDGEGASWGGYYWDGFTLAIGGDQTDYGQSGSSGSWSKNFGGCMAGGGCVINKDGSVTADPAQPYLVAQYSSWASEGPSNQVKFEDAEGNGTFEPAGVYVCNHPWPYYECKHGDGLGRAFAEGDYFELIAHGVPATGSETTVSIKLVEYTNGELKALNDWTFFDLSSLGEVVSVYFTMNSTDMGTYDINTAAYFCMDKFQVKVAAAVPADPTVVEFHDSGDVEGYTYFEFNINLVDVDGNPLEEDNLTYSIFTDNDELFTFDYGTYGQSNEFTTDMTEIPYGYSDYDFYLHRIYFYRTNAEGYEPMFNYRIGIQVHYTVGDVRNSSNIVYYYRKGLSVVLNDKQDNSEVLTDHNGWMVGTTIEGRTIYTDGRWNTLCLPFDLTADQLASSPLAGFEVKELDTATEGYTNPTGYDADSKTLWLNFKAATEIVPGKPYIVRKPAPSDGSTSETTDPIVNPVFRKVFFKSDAPVGVESGDKTFTFIGTYAPVTYKDEDRTVLVMGSDSKLFYPDGKATTTVGAFRAYFQLNGIWGGKPETEGGIKNFVVNFGDGETAIQEIVNGKSSNGKSDDAWYTIDGRKLEGKPTQKGIYINRNKKTFIK